MIEGVAPRVRKRITCGLTVDGVRKPGVVLNLSTSGLFVQTSLKPRPGARVAVDFCLPTHDHSLALAGDVVWRRRVEARFSSFGAGGVGLKIASAPEAYLRYLESLKPAGASNPAAGPEPPHPTYRVRLRKSGTTRSRWVSVASSDEAEAESAAVDELGTGWEVLELRALDTGDGDAA